MYAESLEELISNGEALNLKFLISNEQETFYYPFVDQIYHNEKKYPYLIKIFDSELRSSFFIPPIPLLTGGRLLI